MYCGILVGEGIGFDAYGRPIVDLCLIDEFVDLFFIEMGYIADSGMKEDKDE